MDFRLADDGDRASLGLEPIDDMYSPKDIAANIARCLWGGGDARLAAAGMHEEMCRIARECEGMSARHGIYYQLAYGVLLAARDEQSLSVERAIAAADWAAIWSEAGEIVSPRPPYEWRRGQE